jgi:hypothetical protein
VSSEDGSVLAGANCQKTYHGFDLGYWRSDCLPPGHDRNAAFRSDRLRRAGLDYAGSHLGRLPAVEGVRLLRTFGIWQPRRLVYFAEGRMLPGRSLAVAAVWAALALGLAGAWALRRRRGELAILMAPLVLSIGTSLIAFGYPRFRYPTDVVLLVLTAFVLERAVVARRARYAALRPRPLWRSRV